MAVRGVQLVQQLALVLPVMNIPVVSTPLFMYVCTYVCNVCVYMDVCMYVCI
jgi:hypothetical protein